MLTQNKIVIPIHIPKATKTKICRSKGASLLPLRLTEIIVRSTTARVITPKIARIEIKEPWLIFALCLKFFKAQLYIKSMLKMRILARFLVKSL